MSRDKRTDRDASGAPLFTCRNEGPVTYLRYLPQDDLPDANPRGMVGDLWLKLEKVFAGPQKVLVLEHPRGMLGSQSMARFRQKVSVLSPEYEKHGWGWFPISPRALALQREENVLRRFVEAVTKTDTFVICVFQGEIMLPFLGPALACDYRIVTSKTVFVNHCLKGGLPPVGALAWFLVRHLGYGRTLHLLTNHDSVNATDALQLALVDRVVEDADMEQEVRVCADRFAQIPGRSLVAMKRLLAAASDGLGTYLATEGGVFERWILEQ